MPSACAALTSSCALRSARTRAQSCCSAASASGARGEDACNTGIAASRAAIAQTATRAEFRLKAETTGRRSESRRPATMTLKSQQLIDRAFAVGERIHADPCALEQRQVEVRERRRLGVLDVAASLDAPRGAACNDDRQVHVIVNV